VESERLVMEELANRADNTSKEVNKASKEADKTFNVVGASKEAGKGGGRRRREWISVPPPRQPWLSVKMSSSERTERFTSQFIQLSRVSFVSKSQQERCCEKNSKESSPLIDV